MNNFHSDGRHSLHSSSVAGFSKARPLFLFLHQQLHLSIESSVFGLSGLMPLSCAALLFTQQDAAEHTHDFPSVVWTSDYITVTGPNSCVCAPTVAVNYAQSTADIGARVIN